LTRPTSGVAPKAWNVYLSLRLTLLGLALTAFTVAVVLGLFSVDC
jgi:hypothetical protein